jgi:hypothetical protein
MSEECYARGLPFPETGRDCTVHWICVAQSPPSLRSKFESPYCTMARNPTGHSFCKLPLQQLTRHLEHQNARVPMRYARALPHNLPWLFHFGIVPGRGTPGTACKSSCRLLSVVQHRYFNPPTCPLLDIMSKGGQLSAEWPLALED